MLDQIKEFKMKTINHLKIKNTLRMKFPIKINKEYERERRLL